MILSSLLAYISFSLSLILGLGAGPVKAVPTSTLGFTTDNPDAPNTDEYESLQGSNTENEKSALPNIFSD